MSHECTNDSKQFTISNSVLTRYPCPLGTGWTWGKTYLCPYSNIYIYRNEGKKKTHTGPLPKKKPTMVVEAYLKIDISISTICSTLKYPLLSSIIDAMLRFPGS